MAEEPGAPLPRNAGTTTASQPTPNLTVDEFQRHGRKEVSSFDGGTKPEQWPTEQPRYLSPSPSPSARLSPETGGLLDPPEGHQVLRPQLPFFQRFWARNKGATLVALSQFFGALMNMSARLLELEGDGMHPVQVLLLRQSMTSVCCLTYMWWKKTPGAPFGTRDIRLLLFIRGFSGFFGIYGYVELHVP